MRTANILGRHAARLGRLSSGNAAPAAAGPGRTRAVMVGLCVLLGASPAWGGGGFLQMRNGYFWDPQAGEYFIPRGVAYQTWNVYVGANQSFAQLDYDMLEFKRMRANSVRCEIAWEQVQKSATEYDWSKPDHLVQTAEKLGLKLFILIGYQYPPKWFPKELLGVNNLYTTSNIPTEVPPNVLSDVINYEHPEARRIYSNYIAAVTGRYRDSPAVGGWIVGNEYAYFDLWEDPDTYVVHRFIGYDPVSQAGFRSFLRSAYHGDISALNINWQTNYADFEAVVMPRNYPPDRNCPGYQDLIQWRKQSIGDYVAVGAVAAKQADPNHLITYSMVGGIFSGRDANNTCEDAKTIVARCAAAGAPLDFWSINNYAWAAVGNEMRSADFGISKLQAESGLPVMISETGHSSTETLPGFEGASGRQAKALPSTMWESLLSGAIGVHFFHWSDRRQYTPNYFYRERGFGIVDENRSIKVPVYSNMVAMFRQMENARVDRLLGGSTKPPPDIQCLWSTNADMVWPRANQELAMIWGALKRLGFQPGIIDDRAFEAGAYTNAPALLLCRAYQMNPLHLDRLAQEVIPAGIHVHAETDLPGQFDAYDRPNPNWAALMNSLFGIGVSGAVPGLDAIVTNDFYSPLKLQGIANLAPINPGWAMDFTTWKIWHGITATSAKIIMTDSGFLDSRPGTPALLVKTNLASRGRTAINTFALGDTFAHSSPTSNQWVLRYDVLQAIYTTHFGLRPTVDVSGPGAKQVISNYRLCQNGSVLLFVLNEHTNDASITVKAASLLEGRKLENLITGEVLAERSGGELGLTLGGDEYALLYAYDTTGSHDESLVNSSPNKIWFADAPLTLWPKGSAYDVGIGYDTYADDGNLTLVVALELARPPNRAYGQSAPCTISGMGTNVVQVPVPDADPNDPDYISSRKGARYVFHAWLEKAGTRLSEAFMPVRLAWGVAPASPLPKLIVPGQTYPVTLEWEDLPSYLPGDPTPLDRAMRWDSLQATRQHYSVVLELIAGGQAVVSQSYLTRQGTASHEFAIPVPPGATGPFSWSAHLQTAPNVLSHDVEDSFEGRERGAMWPEDPSRQLPDPTFIAPWHCYAYAWPNTDGVNLWQNQGVHLEGFNSAQSAFLVITNPPNQDYSGFGITFTFPNDWALPEDVGQWTNFAFAYDFTEAHGYACTMEMQLKSTNERWIQFVQPYNPQTNAWNHIQATVDQFVRPEIPGDFVYFDPAHVKTLAVNIAMLAPSVQYVASLDNIWFRGPEQDLGGGSVASIYTSANDVLGGLSIQLSDGNVVISWTGTGVLQTAPEISGPWSNEPAAASPFSVKPLDTRQFYRLSQ